jgi:hypothetical protein
MSPTIKKTRLAFLAGLAVFYAVLVSFSTPTGGEGFEIYLNNHLVMKKYGKEMENVQSLQLGQNSSNGELTIKYWHCGKPAKDRVITVKDAHGKLLREWRFAETAASLSPMNCKVGEIIRLKTGNTSVLKLYYSSSELPEGRLLATITFTSQV